MVSAGSPIPTSNSTPGSFTSKGELARFSKGGCNLTIEYKPHMVTQHSGEAPATASCGLTHSYGIHLYIPRYPSTTLA
jgi:hypothetical protein